MIVGADRVDRIVLLEWQEDEPAPPIDGLMPPGLPPSAVLAVRRVSVVAAPSAVPGAVVAEVAAAARRATRPVRGVVGAGADAVLFADEAELLAGYLLAVRSGRLGDWVWSQLAGVLPPPVVDVVVGDPAVPLAGVVSVLRDWGRADEVLAELSAPGRMTLLQALADQHDLWVRPASPPAPASACGSVADEAPADARVVAPVGKRPRGYDVGRRGSTDALARVVTEAGFVSSVVSLVDQLLGRTRRPLPPVSPSSSSPTLVKEAVSDHAGGDGVITDGPADVEPPAEAPSLSAPSGTRDQHRDDPRSADDAPGMRPRGSEVALADEVPAPVADVAPEGVATGLAGVFYLVNAYRRLDLRAHGLTEAAPWDVIDGLARTALIDDEEHVDDPVWLELQALAGRSPGEPPARDVLDRCATATQLVMRDLALEPDEPRLAELIAVPGRLVLDRTHVEVFVALDAVEIAVRRRALDADPGWVPSLGRVIRFHFVDGGRG